MQIPQQQIADLICEMRSTHLVLKCADDGYLAGPHLVEQRIDGGIHPLRDALSYGLVIAVHLCGPYSSHCLRVRKYIEAS